MIKNKKVFDALLIEAQKDKDWAIEKVKEVGREWKEACKISVDMLNERLDKSVQELAESKYSYLKMRAHAKGNSHSGFIAPDAKAKWEKLSGEVIV